MAMKHLDLPFTAQDIPSLAEIRQQKKALELSVSETGLHALLTLMRVGNDVQAATATHLQEQGISMARFSVLAQLIRANGYRLTPSELSAKTGVTRATITGLIDGLEGSRWIRRQIHPDDRRSVIIELTEEGVTFLRNILPIHAQYITRMIRDIREEDLVQLERTLAQVQNNIEAMGHA